MPKAIGAPDIRTPKRPTPDDRIPRRVMQPTLDDHLEIMTRAIFQAGLSWALIDARWEAFQAAFDRFDIATVGAYGEFEIERLMAADGVVHSAKKIRGTIANANALVAADREFGSIEAYAARFPSYQDLLSDVGRRFAFVGDLSCYYWLFRTGNAVPVLEDWMARQSKDHPRIREMILTGRAASTSSERAGY